MPETLCGRNSRGIYGDRGDVRPMRYRYALGAATTTCGANRAKTSSRMDTLLQPSLAVASLHPTITRHLAMRACAQRHRKTIRLICRAPHALQTDGLLTLSFLEPLSIRYGAIAKSQEKNA